jgi:hypothetical protein
MENRTTTATRERPVRRLAWVAAVVVPVALGGLIGGQFGGLVTAVLLIPWFDRLVRRSQRSQRPHRPAPAKRLRVVEPAAGADAVDDASSQSDDQRSAA